MLGAAGVFYKQIKTNTVCRQHYWTNESVVFSPFIKTAILIRIRDRFNSICGGDCFRGEIIRGVQLPVWTYNANKNIPILHKKEESIIVCKVSSPPIGECSWLQLQQLPFPLESAVGTLIHAWAALVGKLMEAGGEEHRLRFLRSWSWRFINLLACSLISRCNSKDCCSSSSFLRSSSWLLLLCKTLAPATSSRSSFSQTWLENKAEPKTNQAVEDHKDLF